MNNDDYLPLKEFYKQNPLNQSIDTLLRDLLKMTISEPENSLHDVLSHFIISFFSLTLQCNSRQNTSLINALSKFFLKAKQFTLLNQLIAYHIFFQSLIDDLSKDYSSDNDSDFYYQSDLILSPVITRDHQGHIIDLSIAFTSTSPQKLDYLTSGIEFESNFKSKDPLLRYHITYSRFPEGNTLHIEQQDRVLKVKENSDLDLASYRIKDSNDTIAKAILQCEKDVKHKFLNTKRHTKYFHLAFDSFKAFIFTRPSIKDGIDNVFPFGSVTQCTQSIFSDLEITIMTKPNVAEEDIRNEIHSALLDNRAYADVSFRPTKRTYLLIFWDKKNKVKIELTFNNVFGILNSSLIRNYLLSDSRALILVNVIKDWSKNNKINSNHDGYLSSYCFTLMAIYFLQRIDPPVLPVISSKGQLTSFFVLEHHYCIETVLLKPYAFQPSDNKDTVAVLILKFFLFYYAHFNEDFYCINITNHLETIRNHEIVYLNYFNERNSKGSVYCFIDPFDCSYNPGAYLERNTLAHKRFKHILKLSIENILKGKPFLLINEEEQYLANAG